MAGEAALAVGVVTGDVESSLLANVHLGDTLIPALDDLADTNSGDEVAAADGGVELGALVVGLGGILEEASVLNSDGLAGLGDGAGTGLVSRLGNTHFVGLYVIGDVVGVCGLVMLVGKNCQRRKLREATALKTRAAKAGKGNPSGVDGGWR